MCLQCLVRKSQKTLHQKKLPPRTRCGKDLLVLIKNGSGCWNEPKSSPKGNHRGWFSWGHSISHSLHLSKQQEDKGGRKLPRNCLGVRHIAGREVFSCTSPPLRSCAVNSMGERCFPKTHPSAPQLQAASHANLCFVPRAPRYSRVRGLFRNEVQLLDTANTILHAESLRMTVLAEHHITVLVTERVAPKRKILCKRRCVVAWCLVNVMTLARTPCSISTS